MSGIWLASYLVLWVLMLVVAVVLISVLHNLGVVYATLKQSRRQGGPSTNLKPGQVLPEAIFQTLDGKTKTTSDLRGTPRAIALVSPSCGSCVEYLRSIAEKQPPMDLLDLSGLDLVIVSLGDVDGTVNLLERAGLLGLSSSVLLDPHREATEKWGLSATPTTVMVDANLQVVRQIFGEGERTQPALTSTIEVDTLMEVGQ
jgi:Redoxin